MVNVYVLLLMGNAVANRHLLFTSGGCCSQDPYCSLRVALFTGSVTVHFRAGIVHRIRYCSGNRVQVREGGVGI